MSRSGELRCCLRCGRDTAAASGYCNRCVGRRSPFQTDEYKDRKCRNIKHSNQSAIPEIEDRYHGTVFRDDI